MEEQHKTETTLDDIFEVVSFIKDNAATKEEFHKEITAIKSAILTKEELHKEITAIKFDMATKDFVTEKLFDLQGNLVVLMRKEDTKLKVLVETLTEKHVITEEDKKRILSLEPFPSLI